jgi:uracil-DNA glycosylase
MLDARRKLEVLRAEWEGCTKCELGVRRELYKGRFVFGEGTKRGIMFIGEGPGQKEELLGRPFMGPSGLLLRHILGKLKITDFYISNLVTCRSCSQAKTSDGEPIFFPGHRGRPPEPRWTDEPPLPPYWKACLPRLHEEIYLVDPCIVVTLGATAAEALLGKRIAITQKRGEPERLSIPGASYQPILTDKRQAWQRKHEGRWIAPTETNEVHYYCLPTIHPAFVLRKLSDLHPDESPFKKLVEDIQFAVKVYDDFNARSFGKTPPEASEMSIEAVRQGLEPEEENELTE